MSNVIEFDARKQAKVKAWLHELEINGECKITYGITLFSREMLDGYSFTPAGFGYTGWDESGLWIHNEFEDSIKPTSKEELLKLV
jgi:hypothetical protein